MATLTGCEYLSDSDLEDVAGPLIVDQIFVDDGSGTRNAGRMGKAGKRAEDDAAARLLRGWNRDQIKKLMTTDDGTRCHVAWMAVHYGSARKTAFQGEDGKGAFKAQYDEAIDHLEMLSKARRQSVGEADAGENAQTRGVVMPTLPDGSARFIFAPTKTRPRGGGLY